ncbi:MULTISPECIES: Panacea domain-containing protein [Bacillus]|uniref:Panacea domain-containing protein n=1 Tax=Bacillus TaxID=1386 RepID=UPI00026BA321|nr:MULTISPECIES: type II toxin-antitoxin system antitoxin SocA domain-containing protein [Bacillus]AIW30975.1 hypothetical protein KO64_14325 [Bacillus subtilis]EJD65707.1 hypothetical protein BB65665_20129 [Bacillus sp. 916]MBU8887534.1 DUF4065 domain-containing protein [Bacillus sp. FJAT-27001]PAD65233.1 DUF4065 domain-containing protein [Bacillus siamensis]
MPRDILPIAAALESLYKSIFNVSEEENDLTEMKMHKLLYFAQKHHYATFGEWLFNNDFEGWVHGPVSRRVRGSFNMLEFYKDELTLEEEYTLREIIHDYGKFTAGYLRNLSHEDTAYKISRLGLHDDENGTDIIKKEDIINDITINDEQLIDCEVH